MDLSKLSLTNTTDLAKELAAGGGISYRAELLEDKTIWKAHLRRPSGELCRLLKVHGTPDDKTFLSINAIYTFHQRFFPDAASLVLPLQVGTWGDYHYADGSQRPFGRN